MKNHLLLFLLFITGGVSAQTVYFNPGGKSYHAETCGYIGASSNSASLETATDKGLTACSICQGVVSINNAPGAPRTNSSYKAASNSSGYKSSTYSSSSTGSSQCTGRTQKGARCKRMTLSASGRCYQH